MNADCYFRLIVQPTVDEFLRDTKDVRHGVLAAMVLYHMADYAAMDDYDGRDRKKMEQQRTALCANLVERCADFALLGDIANAAKHRRLSQSKNSSRNMHDAG